MNKNEIIFYASVAVATLLIEFANHYGTGLCVFLPLMYIVMFFGFKAFPTNR
jgi:hypothetical protein